MSNHNCPRIDYSSGPVPVVRNDRKCWLCESASRAKHAAFMPYLAEMQAWVTGDAEMSQELEFELYNWFFVEMDYGTQTGDDNTFDQWLCDRPEYVEDLIDSVEYYCVEERAS